MLRPIAATAITMLFACDDHSIPWTQNLQIPLVTGTLTGHSISLIVEGITADKPLQIELLDHLDQPRAGYTATLASNGVNQAITWPKPLPNGAHEPRIHYPLGSKAKLYAVYVSE
jgi:hypothetical protein